MEKLIIERPLEGRPFNTEKIMHFLWHGTTEGFKERRMTESFKERTQREQQHRNF